MKRGLAVAVGIGVFLLTTLVGVTIATDSGDLTRASTYDMPPVQTQQFLKTAGRKLGWTADENLFRVPVLPWKSVQVRTTVEPSGQGSQVILYGPSSQVVQLDELLKRQLPPLQ